MKLPNLSSLGEKCKKLSDDLNLDEKITKLSDTIEEKYTEISNAIDLDSKISKASDILDNLGVKREKTSDALEADRISTKSSSTLDNSRTSKPKERQPESFGTPNTFSADSCTKSATPNIDLAFSNALNHHDKKYVGMPKTHGSKENSEAPPNTPNSSDPAPFTRSVIPDINLTFPAALPSCKEISDASHADPRILTYYMSCYDNGSAFSDRDFDEYFIKDAGSAKQILKILKNKDWIHEKDPVSILMASYTVEELRTFLRLQGLKVSGKKEELARRLSENVSPEDFKRTYKRTLYSLTELGKKYIQAKKTDHDRAIMISTGAIKNLNFSDAVRIYNSYDARWGFLHASGKPHTIFAGYEVLSKCFDYVISYPMHELQNSNSFKKDLRAFLVSVLMRGERNWVTLREEFMLINQEPICCPNISDLNRYDCDDDFFSENPDEIIDSMRRRIEENPDCVLNYYICKILYKSQRA